jgi:hypothetical protein
MPEPEPKLVAINFKPIAAKWRGIKVGMTISQLLALGSLTSSTIKDKCARKDHLVFDPPLPKRIIGRPVGFQLPPKPKRLCMCCRREFKSVGRFNRLCPSCSSRASNASPFENEG